jgi:release factor glutamine methyltransferase
MNAPERDVLSQASTVRAAVAWATSVLSAAEVPSARLDAEVLLTHVLGWTRARLYAAPEQELTDAQREAFQATVERRRGHEPVPYIVGQREFYALDFVVDRRVLIPRPETELLVEHTLESAARLQNVQGLTLVDVGTGSGIVAVSLAVHLPHAVVYATDASTEVLEVAALNAARHHVSERVRFLHGNLLDPLPQPVHVIVANLPYISTWRVTSLARDVVDYEPRLALDGGADGLRLVDELLAAAGRWLRPGGVIWLEIGAFQGQKTLALARQYFPTAQVEVYQDYAGLDRNVRIQPASAAEA